MLLLLHGEPSCIAAHAGQARGVPEPHMAKLASSILFDNRAINCKLWQHRAAGQYCKSRRSCMLDLMNGRRRVQGRSTSKMSLISSLPSLTCSKSQQPLPQQLSISCIVVGSGKAFVIKCIRTQRRVSGDGLTFPCTQSSRASGSSSAKTIQSMHPAANPSARGSNELKVSTNINDTTARRGWGREVANVHQNACCAVMPLATSTVATASPSGMLCSPIAIVTNSPCNQMMAGS